MPTEPQQGLVLRIDAKSCQVEIDGERHALPLAGKLFEQRGHEKRPVAVGDHVVIRQGDGGKVIDGVLPRQTRLQRRAASEGEAQRAQVIAANISLVMVVASAAEPPFQPELVDGVLAAAQREKIPAVIVLTKMDRDKKGRAQHWIDLYRGLGFRVFPTSTSPKVPTPTEFAQIAELLRANQSVLCGLSGVGKSTLLNTVIPDLNLRIGSLSHIRQGKHTTSHTQLIPLPGGGHVLDTPGIRSFHLFQTGSQETQFLFGEIGALLPKCEYRNCLHLDEPVCAVTEALANGDITPSRYQSYARLVNTALEVEGRAVRSHPGVDDGPSKKRARRP